jgi:hypothetical protein
MTCPTSRLTRARGLPGSVIAVDVWRSFRVWNVSTDTGTGRPEVSRRGPLSSMPGPPAKSGLRRSPPVGAKGSVSWDELWVVGRWTCRQSPGERISGDERVTRQGPDPSRTGVSRTWSGSIWCEIRPSAPVPSCRRCRAPRTKPRWTARTTLRPHACQVHERAAVKGDGPAVISQLRPESPVREELDDSLHRARVRIGARVAADGPVVCRDQPVRPRPAGVERGLSSTGSYQPLGEQAGQQAVGGGAVRTLGGDRSVHQAGPAGALGPRGDPCDQPVPSQPVEVEPHRVDAQLHRAGERLGVLRPPARPQGRQDGVPADAGRRSCPCTGHGS